MTGFKRTGLSSSGAMRPTTTKAEIRLNKTQENKRENQQPIGKQHADNQSEEDKIHIGGNGRERGRNRKGKRVNYIFFSFHLNLINII